MVLRLNSRKLEVSLALGQRKDDELTWSSALLDCLLGTMLHPKHGCKRWNEPLSVISHQKHWSQIISIVSRQIAILEEEISKGIKFVSFISFL